MTTLSIVYVLTNPAMPGLVKIGYTLSEDAAARIAQLYASGVPFPFKLEFAAKVTNAEEVERALHRAFAPNRVNPKREFFSIEPDQAIAILKLLHTEDVTKEVQQLPSTIQTQEVNAADEYAARRPNFNFEEMGIPVGSALVFRDGGTTVTVTAPKKVRLEDEEISLTAATRTLLGLDYSVAPGPYWTFNGRSLRDIYDETYSCSQVAQGIWAEVFALRHTLCSANHGAARALPIRYGVYRPHTSKVDRTSLSEARARRT